MIPFKNRFHGHSSLKYVYKNGAVVRSRFATLKSSNNSRRKDSRIAVVVGKKIIKSAVSRNRIRRRVYEYIREQLPRFAHVTDVVVIVSSSELLNMPSSELGSEIEALFEESALYKTPKN